MNTLFTRIFKVTLNWDILLTKCTTVQLHCVYNSNIKMQTKLINLISSLIMTQCVYLVWYNLILLNSFNTFQMSRVRYYFYTSNAVFSKGKDIPRHIKRIKPVQWECFSVSLINFCLTYVFLSVSMSVWL